MANKGAAAQDGFTLLETICALAIIGLVSAGPVPGISFGASRPAFEYSAAENPGPLQQEPAIPFGTSRTAFESYAVKIAALIKQDRQTAIERGVMTATLIDPASRRIASGVSGASVILPRDVVLSAVLARNCRGAPADQSIRFFPSGLSCGGTLFLGRLGLSLQIRVNWLTGGVEIVPGDAA